MKQITAAAPADNADTSRVGQLLVNQPARAVSDIVLHRKAPLLVPSPFESRAMTGGAAELQLQDAIATAGKELRLPIEPTKIMQ